jgi:hypothetical protein
MSFVKAGQLVEERVLGSQPYKIWHTDRYECECGATVNVIGPGQKPFSEHWQPGYAELAAKAEYHYGEDRPC